LQRPPLQHRASRSPVQVGAGVGSGVQQIVPNVPQRRQPIVPNAPLVCKQQRLPIEVSLKYRCPLRMLEWVSAAAFSKLIGCVTAMTTRRKEEAPAVDDLWKHVTAEHGAEGPVTLGGNESFTLFVGQRQSGKSTLVTAFHNPSKDDAPKPTVALEYLFARRSAVSSAAKDVAHIWELGGGAKLGDLVRVPLSTLTLSRAVVVVVVDLSQPQNLVPALGIWFELLRARCDECVAQLRALDPKAAEQLLAAAAARAGGESHADRASVRPLPVPVVLVGNKLDVLKEQDPAARRLACLCLRFVAHYNGAALLTCGLKDKASQANLRSTLTAHLFRLPEAGQAGEKRMGRRDVNADKPMCVGAGADSFEDIVKGLPKGVDEGLFLSKRGLVDAPGLRNWARALEERFGPPAPRDEDMPGGAAGREEEKGMDRDLKGEFAEPLVDEARGQRE